MNPRMTQACVENVDEHDPVDLSKLKAGDKVKFRCGGEAVVESVIDNFSKEAGWYEVKFEGFKWREEYHPDGFVGGTGFDEAIGDIIAIEPKPFDWSEVRPGMAFNQRQGLRKTLVYFLGYHPVKPFRLFFIGEEAITAESFSVKAALDQLTRAPEHDIEVQS